MSKEYVEDATEAREKEFEAFYAQHEQSGLEDYIIPQISPWTHKPAIPEWPYIVNAFLQWQWRYCGIASLLKSEADKLVGHDLAYAPLLTLAVTLEQAFSDHNRVFEWATDVWPFDPVIKEYFADSKTEEDQPQESPVAQAVEKRAPNPSASKWDPYRTPTSKEEFCLEEWLVATKGLVENIHIALGQLTMGRSQEEDALLGIYSALKNKLYFLERYGCQ